jgi:hypothetical protein
MNVSWLNKALLAGVAYFCCMAVAHFVGLKWPVLFVYYDTPFYAYQDKIISFAVVAYACLFFVAARSREAVPAALVSIWITVLGLSSVNLSSALASVLQGQGTSAYWMQTCAIAAYALLLTLLYLRERRA